MCTIKYKIQTERDYIESLRKVRVAHSIKMGSIGWLRKTSSQEGSGRGSGMVLAKQRKGSRLHSGQITGYVLLPL